jgi:Protein of unknown function (DUF1442)
MVWPTENALSAYLKTMETVNNNSNDSDVAGFIAALAARSGTKLMAEACSGPARPTTRALVSAACQTSGQVVCILPGLDELQASIDAIRLEDVRRVKLVVGDATEMLINRV